MDLNGIYERYREIKDSRAGSPDSKFRNPLDRWESPEVSYTWHMLSRATPTTRLRLYKSLNPSSFYALSHQLVPMSSNESSNVLFVNFDASKAKLLCWCRAFSIKHGGKASCDHHWSAGHTWNASWDVARVAIGMILRSWAITCNAYMHGLCQKEGEDMEKILLHGRHQ